MANKNDDRSQLGPDKAVPKSERRFIKVELRAEESGEIVMRIPYDVETDLGYFREVIRPGFFKAAIDEGHDVVAWYQHGEGAPLPLGRTTAKTLVLREKDNGLEAVATPPDRPWVDDVRASIERGDVNGASFAFGDPVQRWTEEPDVLPLRELLSAVIWDVSPVVFPAYPQTDSALRDDTERVFREYRAKNPEAGQAAAEGGDEDPGQAVEVLQRQTELHELNARYHLNTNNKEI